MALHDDAAVCVSRFMPTAYASRVDLESLHRCRSVATSKWSPSFRRVFGNLRATLLLRRAVYLVMRGARDEVSDVSAGLTDLSLSCAAKARVPKSRGRQVAAYTARRKRAICTLHDAATLVFGRGASAPDRSRAAAAAARS